MRHLLLIVTVGGIALLSLVSSAESQGRKKSKASIWSENKDAFGDPLPIGAVARIGAMRYRLPEGRQPNGVVLSPDARLLAIAGLDNDIDLWELPAWIKHKNLKGRNIDKKGTLNFSSMAFSPDSKQLLVADANQGNIHFLDVATGKSVKKITLPKSNANQMTNLTLSADQKTLVAAVNSNRGQALVQQFLVWDLLADKLLRNFEITSNRNDPSASRTALSTDANWLAKTVATENPNNRGGVEISLEIWDVRAGKALHRLETDVPLAALALSPDGKRLAATDGFSTLRFFDVPTGKETHNLRMRRTAIAMLQFAPDGNSLYVAEFNGSISQWNPVSAEETARYKVSVNAGANQIAFLPDGGMRALGIGNDAIHFWDVKTGKMLSPTGVPSGFIDDVAFTPGGELFVAAEDGHAAWWNPRTAVKLRDLKLDAPASPELPDRNYFGVARVFNIDGPGFPRHRGNPGGMLTMTSDGDFLASGADGGLAFFDAKTGKLLYDDVVPNNINSLISFFDAGQKVASVHHKKLRVWNTRTGRDIAKVDLPLRNQEQVVKLTASGKGTYFAMATTPTNGEINQGRGLMWDAGKKKLLREWGTPNREDFLRFSPDDQWLAAAGNGNQVRLMRVENARGDHVLNLGKNHVDITQVAFSPDGRQLAIATIVPRGINESGAIVLYEVASRKVRLEIVGHPTGIIDRLAYAHDSGLLASGASDTTVLVWAAGLRAFADQRAAKGASADELKEWFGELANVNAKTAFQHMIKFARSPAQTVSHFNDQIAPAKKPDSGEKTIPQWIRELGSSTFPVRTRANTILQKLGPAAEPDLRAALPKAEDVETKRRIEELLERIALAEWTPEELQQARAVEVLEAIGSAEARAVLTRWTSGDPGAVLTKEARQALAASR